MKAPVSTRLLRETDLPEAGRIVRLAFGTFLGIPDPENAFPDVDYVTTRWKADPEAAFAAEIDGRLVGSNFATGWGSVGFFGPLTVHPEFWNQGVGESLMEPVMERFARLRNTHNGLYTFPHSPKHLHLYQKFGFWPRFLTALMSLPVGEAATDSHRTRYSEAPPEQQESLRRACREVTDAIYEGLDAGREIRAAEEQRLGDTVLIWDGAKLAGLAVCHCGPGTEAGNGACYAKFGAVRPGPTAPGNFHRLLDGCLVLVASRRTGPLALHRRSEPGPARSLSSDARARLSNGLSGRRHAPPQRAGLQPSRRLRPGRLALARNYMAGVPA